MNSDVLIIKNKSFTILDKISSWETDEAYYIVLCEKDDLLLLIDNTNVRSYVFRPLTINNGISDTNKGIYEVKLSTKNIQ